MKTIWLAAPLVLALCVGLAPNAAGQAKKQPAPAASEPALEPKAVDLLKAMSARLAAARTMSFTAVATYESPSRLGPPLTYTTLSEVTLQRPDKLRVITPGDGPASEFYYDGTTMMAYAPAANLVALAPAPATIDAALKQAYDSAAIYFPFTDVIVADPYEDIADELKRAFYIGQSHVVGATTTDMVGIAGGKIFAQIWIGEDKLPRRIRVVYASDPARLRQEVDFSNWKLDAPLAAEDFTSARAAGATHIEFARPDPRPLPEPAKAQGKVAPNAKTK